MTKLIFATNNQNKVEEIKSLIGRFCDIVSLKEAEIQIDIPEPHNTLEANASEKSAAIYNLTGQNCFGEDTGLEVVALHGEPGVKSARYAGEGRRPEDNKKKLLNDLKDSKNREARFRTVISLMLNGSEKLFEGICEGHISIEPKGEKGFGYDSIFVPLGETKTFAEMTLDEKNLFSHRMKAIEQLISYLSQNGKKLFQ